MRQRGGTSRLYPALGVDRSRAIKLNFAVIDLVSDSADHPAIFEFVEATLRRGKDNYRQTGVPVDQQFHIAAQPGRVPLVIFAMHMPIPWPS